MAARRRRHKLPNIDPQAEVLNVAEAVRLSKLGRDYVYGHLALPGRGPGAWIPVIDIGDRRVRIPRAAFLAALAKHTVTTAPMPKKAVAR
jgi:hypothetical protein